MIEFSGLEEALGISFKDKEILAQAFCHRSYLNENPDFKRGNNERMEFLGDAVLELVVSDDLFRNYPENKEGILTSLRAALVNSKMLCKIAKELNFGKFLLLSKGEKKEKGKAREEILANTTEAFIGALYIDQGYDACDDFIKKNIMPKLEAILENEDFIDDKSRFQEIAQEKEKITPRYEVLEEWGPDHNKIFEVGVFLGDELIARGRGKAKQEAEEEAAREGLNKRKWI